MARRLRHLAVLLALLANGMASAEPLALQVSADGETIFIHGLAAPEQAELRTAGATRGVSLKPEPTNSHAFSLALDWPLMPATDYELVLGSAEQARIVPVTLSTQSSQPAQVLRVSPGVATLPANTLRLYVHFDAPMARGSASQFIRLLDAKGRVIPDAFLNIGVELWSADQTRLTVLLDPGRIKRGVGPNRALGLALEPGQRHAIEVMAGMPDARNRPLKDGHRHWFSVGAAERAQIVPAEWSASMGVTELTVTFDRPMDEASVLRHIGLLDAGGERVFAAADMSGRILTFTLPDAGNAHPHKLFVAAGLEDAAGNTLCAAFDVEAGEGRTCRTGVTIDLLDFE